MKIGLTGNIACGKSTVARVLAQHGWTHIDTDQLAREVVAPGSEGLRRIVETFGPGVLSPTGELNREALGQVVFADAEKRRLLNAITHPAIARLTLERMAAAPGHVVVSVPLLFEANMQGMFDEVWVVAASEDTQLGRIMARDGLPEDQARARMAAQAPLGPKMTAAHEVFHNNGSLDELITQVQGRLAARGL